MLISGVVLFLVFIYVEWGFVELPILPSMYLFPSGLEVLYLTVFLKSY
jgi:hypothetical protein